MDIVYLGHQTLLVESGGVRILVDPVLRHAMEEERIAMYPPKAIDDAGLFPVHAVILTHTHLDHIDREAFERINKDAIFFISCLSYGRLAPLIAEHGFEPGKIVPLQPSSQVTLGPIRVSGARFARLTNEYGLNEPDVMPVVLHDGSSGLLNFVDIFPDDPQDIRDVEETFGPLSAVMTSWNYTRGRSEIYQGPVDVPAELEESAQGLVDLFGAFGVPHTMVVGAGFVLDGNYEAYNRHLFPIGKEAVCERANARGGVTFHALELGRRYHLEGREVTAGERVEWVDPAETTDVQAYDATAPVPKSYLPFLPPTDLTEAEWAEVHAFLEDAYRPYLKYRYLTQVFFAGLVYKSSYHEGLGLWLQSPSGPTGFRFVRGTEDVEVYRDVSAEELRCCHVWVEMTARDFLGLVRGEIVLIDPIYYDLKAEPEFLENIDVPQSALFREPLGVFDPYYHGRALSRAVLGPT